MFCSDPEEIGRWLACKNIDYYCSDEEFAMTMFYLWKYQNMEEDMLKAKPLMVTAEDVKQFDIEGFCDWMKGVLNEIVRSKEIDRGAWWKQEE